ncbi:5-formyltetrahydrofolate cyclo-ligase [Dysgonomonas sp. 511]|uniref:5-formyltetrahydrofolate cyclo-ligase n=1 Tax=Dysgonomonas sp. 511 TaxID=2302930 RepID=UPI0013D5F12C|nr:5-formyltetrahydrofolate cyclo-ligase [Dysgonomonas sp. 511]NDV77421.1 5-formyltetrahydrofolate cyclo-ligase [Dysgonomonas sp. 511]
MKNIKQAKDELRKRISAEKKKMPKDELAEKSQEVLDIVEMTGVFQSAKNIFLYNSLSDEIQTSAFLDKWCTEKKIYLPVVLGDDIVFRPYSKSTALQQSAYGIHEPEGENFTDYKKVDLVIVPGVAFDRKMNRLGRGKGYYDRFLKKLTAPKMGICFEFQLLDSVPTNENDVKMDYLVSENDLIWQ